MRCVSVCVCVCTWSRAARFPSLFVPSPSDTGMNVVLWSCNSSLPNMNQVGQPAKTPAPPPPGYETTGPTNSNNNSSNKKCISERRVNPSDGEIFISRDYPKHISRQSWPSPSERASPVDLQPALQRVRPAHRSQQRRQHKTGPRWILNRCGAASCSERFSSSSSSFSHSSSPSSSSVRPNLFHFDSTRTHVTLPQRLTVIDSIIAPASSHCRHIPIHISNLLQPSDRSLQPFD